MILARISKAVRQQNWFAVALEFIIVIAGVVIGFQITSWNAERELRAQADAYLHRLHGEVEELIAIRSDLTERRQRMNDNLSSAIAVLQGISEREDLTDDECIAISEAHIYSNPTDELPTLSEMLAAGRLDDLSDTQLRDRLMRYYQIRARGRNGLESININVHELPVVFVQYFEQTLVEPPADQVVRQISYKCDTAGMRADTSFLAHLFSNAERYEANLNGNILRLNEELVSLRAALIEILGESAQ